MLYFPSFYKQATFNEGFLSPPLPESFAVMLKTIKLKKSTHPEWIRTTSKTETLTKARQVSNDNSNPLKMEIDFNGS